MWAFIILATILWFVGVLYLIYATFYRLTRKEIFVPFVPADKNGIDAMCQAVGLTGKEKVVDIGSGWGSIVFYLAQKFPKISVTGIELNPMLHLVSLVKKSLFYRSSNISLSRGDAVVFDYKKFNVVFIFMLSPFVNKVMVPKLETELRKGAKVVSYVFQMKSDLFTEKKIILPVHGWKSAVYVYEKIA